MRPLLLALLLLSSLVPACTFNVDWLDRHVVSEDDPGAYTLLTVDATTEDSPLRDAALVVRGSERSDTIADAHVVGLLGIDDDADELMLGYAVTLARRSDEAVWLGVVEPEGHDDSRIYVETVTVSLPSARDLLLLTDSGSIDVTGVSGRIEAHCTSGSIDVDGTGTVDLDASSGSIRVAAAAGNAHTTSGSIELDLDGWAVASATSGSIDGRIGDGGSLTATSGSIRVELTQPLTRDLMLAATSGSIELVVPAGSPMHLDLDAGSGSVNVHAGAIDYAGESFRGDVGRGGFTVYARAGSGSIEIREASR